MSLLPSLILTEEQQAIVTAAASCRNLMIAALAGTGKTCTLKMIAETYPERRGLYLSYNKALQLEAKAKFPSVNGKVKVRQMAEQKCTTLSLLTTYFTFSVFSSIYCL